MTRHLWMWGRYVQNRLKHAISCFFSLPKLCLWFFFEGGGAKPWYFTALEASPPSNSIAAVGFRFWVSSKARGRSGAGVRRGDARFCFLIHVYPIDISRLKSGIRRTPPTGWIFHVVRWNISQKFLALPTLKYSRVKGGDLQNIFAKMLRSPTVHNCWIGSIYFEVGHSCRL